MTVTMTADDASSIIRVSAALAERARPGCQCTKVEWRKAA